MKRKGLYWGFLTILLVVLGVFLLQDRSPLPVTDALATEIEMKATESDAAGVELTSGFMIKTAASLDAEAVEKSLRVQPEIKLKIEDLGKKGEIMVIPQEPLSSDKIYQFTLALPDITPIKWAFQTKGDFKVNATFPRDKSTGVPTNTGIEITLSHDNFQNPAAFFEISPKVKGKFEIHKKTMVFIPENLSPGTVYKVTLKKGLGIVDSSMALTEDTVFEFETQDPLLHNETDYSFDFFANTMEFPEGISPTIPLGYYDVKNSALPSMTVDVYHYQSAQSYIDSLMKREETPYWAYLTRSAYREDSGKLAKFFQFTTKLKKYDQQYFLIFPEPMVAGYYLAEVKLGNVSRQIWFQVTNLALYTAITEEEALVWVNDLVKKTPVSQGEIMVTGGETAATNQNGLAKLAVPEQMDQGFYYVVKQGTQEAVGMALPYPKLYADLSSADNIGQNYWKYLYLDRGLYKSDDTVNFWGIIKDRLQGSNTPLELTAAVTKWNENGETLVTDIEKVTVDSYTFSGSVKLPNLLPGYYNFKVSLGEETLLQQGFDVEAYTKPSYQVKIEPETKALFAGEKTNFRVKTVFYEDTPVPNLSLHYYMNEQQGDIETDQSGSAVISFQPQYLKESYGVWQARNISIKAVLPEKGEIIGESSVIVLNNDIRINAEGAVIKNKGTVNITLDKLSVGRVNQGEADPWDENSYLDGPAAKHQVEVNVYRQEWIKHPDGEYYDYINKKVEKRYWYEEQKVPVTSDIIITDYQGRGSFSFTVDSTATYIIEVKTKDFKGNDAISQIYLAGEEIDRETGFSWYHLTDQNSREKYDAGESISLKMKVNQGNIAAREKSFLFMEAREGLRDYLVKGTSSYQTSFTEAAIPNFWVRGVYFDGRTYHETGDYLAAYQEKNKELEITVTTDKQEYRPNDLVRVSIRVRDQAGRPVRGIVNLNLVDEAIYSLSAQEVDLLQSLYSDYLRSGIISSAATHGDKSYLGGGAEQGGEGGSLRRDFKDAVYFDTVITDGSGQADTSFRVPDNLTSWRLTYQGITKDLKAGSGIKEIPVRLPFFVDLVANSAYLSGDCPEVYLRSYGSDLSAGKTVTYHVTLEGPGDTYEKTLFGKAFEAIPVSLPKLTQGTYNITITGSAAGNETDTIVLPIVVHDTFMKADKVGFSLLRENQQIQGSEDYPTTLVFADYLRTQYLSLLCELKNIGGNRIDQKTAAMMAEELLEKYFPDLAGAARASTFDAEAYQAPSGGIASLPYGSSDLELSAKIASLAGDSFDRTSLKRYFYQLTESRGESRERVIEALYGLSALGEPVLQDVLKMRQEKELTVKEEMYLLLAQTELGDLQPGKKRFAELIKKYGELSGAGLRVNSGNDADEIAEITALAAVLAARLDAGDENKLQQYVMENPPAESLAYVEQLMFLKEMLPKLPETEVGFAYHLNEKDRTEKLANGKIVTLSLTPEELAKISFTDINGQVGMTSLYRGDFVRPQINSSSQISLKREYFVAGKAVSQFKLNDLVEIRISYEVGGKTPAAPYQVTDYLPAGLKLVEKPQGWYLLNNKLNWPLEVDGQRVVFLANKHRGSIQYYARVVSGGEYMAESTVINTMNDGKVYGIAEPAMVTIQ